MPPRATASDERLLEEIEIGNMRATEKLLAGGTSADGSRELSYRPLMVAAKYGYVRIMKLLVEKGANVEASTTDDGRDIYGRSNTIVAGTRALHAAAFSGRVEALGVLLQAGANPNVTDSEGYTALMGVCSEQGVADTRLAMVRVLLEAGANPVAATFGGMVAMHMAASTGATDVIDLLCSRAPTTLNRITLRSSTPLCTAAMHGQESAVAKLLALGATDEVLAQRGTSALTVAVQRGEVGIVRILLGSAQAKRAVGGTSLFPQAMGVAVSYKGRNGAKILQMLLDVEGEERRRHWLGLSLGEGPMLHAAVAFNSLAAAHVLLAAGANEAEANGAGERARDFVGSALPICERDDDMEAAICRMLQRGPAFRARSWAWSPGTAGAPPPGGEVLSASGRLPRAPLGVRIFRPMGSRRFFAGRFVRYANR